MTTRSGPPDGDALAAFRAVSLYVLAVASVAQAELAWLDPSPARLAGWTVALAAATAGGQIVAPLLHGLERALRERLRLGLTAACGGALVLGGLVAMAAPDASLIRREVAAFVWLQLVVMLLGGVRGDELAAVANALALVVLTSLRGGLPAAAAAVAWTGSLAAFLVLDHFARRLALFRLDGAVAGAALRQACTLGGVAGAVLAVFLFVFPPAAFPGVIWDVPGAAATPMRVIAAYRVLVVLGLVAGAGLYLIIRLFRARPRRPPTSQELVEVQRSADEPLPEPPRRPHVAYAGTRGRIVQLYLAFLGHAARVGFVRRPDLTAREFAAHVREPAGPLSALTGAFVRARYGPDEPTTEDVHAAERAADELRAALRGARPRKA